VAVVAPVLHWIAPEQLLAVNVMASPPQLVVFEAVITGTPVDVVTVTV